MKIHDLGEKIHGLAIAALIAGAFAVSSAYAGPLESRAFPGGCIGGNFCGGFTSFFRAQFTQAVALSTVQFPVIAIPTTPVGRVLVDLYANGQRIVQGLDITGNNHWVTVPLPSLNAWDLTIVPTTFDEIQLGTVTVTFAACAAGSDPGYPSYPYPYPYPNPDPAQPYQPYPGGGSNPYPASGSGASSGNGNVSPVYPVSQTSNGGQTLHCASTAGQTTQCATGLTQVTNVQIAGASAASPTTSASCQYGVNWGVSGTQLWVSDGCTGDFIVQGS